MVELEDRILAHLQNNPNSSFNFSEISRVVEKAPPTVKRAVERFKKINKVDIIDKKLKKLVRLSR